MRFKITYMIDTVTTFTEREGDKFVRRSNEHTIFAHEEVDIDEICELLALKYRNENYSADQYVKISCNVD